MIGWMVVLVVAGAGAAKPESTAVLLTKRGGSIEGRAVVAAGAVEQALRTEGVPFALSKEELAQRLAGLGVQSAADCGKKKKCVLELASQLNLPSVVAVSVAQVGADLSVHAELLEVTNGAKLAEDTLVVPADAAATLAARFAPFAQKVRAAMAPRAPAPAVVAAVDATPKVADAPVKAPEARLEPSPLPPPPVVIAEPPSRAPAFVAGGLGVVALGVGAGFLVSALGDKSQVDARAKSLQGVPTSTLSGSEAQALAASANGKFTAALVGAAVGVAAAGVAAVLWGAGTPAGK